jgi:hypothetical protein
MTKYPRVDNDAYFSEAYVLEVLAKNWRIPGIVWEPAAGGHALAAPLQQMGKQVFTSDIKTYGPAHTAELDFLQAEKPIRESVQGIITNSPYKLPLADQFIAKALSFMAQPGSQVSMAAFLLPTEFSHAPTRRATFALPFACKLEITSRIRFFENTTGRPRKMHAWYIFDKHHTGQAYHKIQG